MGIDQRDPTPLYLQIANDIKSQIANGVLPENGKLNSQQELSEKYNVSLITVKKALEKLVNEGQLISRVGKGTYVIRKISRVDLSQSITLGLVLRDLDSPFFSRIVRSAEKRATELDYNVLLKSTLNRADNKEKQIRQFRQQGVNGLIIASMTHVYNPSTIIKKLHEEEFPYVVVSYIDDPNIYFVGTDHELGGYMATEHLIELGYKNIGYINGEEGNKVGDLRLVGYQNALEQYGRSIDERTIFRLEFGGEWNDYESGFKIGQYFTAMKKRPDAMFCYNDLSALGFQRAVMEMGLNVPGDVAVIGFDGITQGVTASVPLTTIRQPTDIIGGLAVDILKKRINGEPVDVRTILEPELVIRQSCGG